MTKIKKPSIIILAVILLSGLFCNFFTEDSLADMSAPFYFQYDIIVTDQNGISAQRDYYDSENKEIKTETITIPKGETLTVLWEYGENRVGISYHDHTYEITLDGIDYASDSFDVNSLNPSESISRYVYKEGAYLYNGPAERYGKIDGDYQLPVGITVSSNKYDDGWVYVNFDNHSGWAKHSNHPAIYSEDIALANISASSLFVMGPVKLYASPFDETPVSTINSPELTQISTDYSIYYALKSSAKHVNYNGQDGWIKNSYINIAQTPSNQNQGYMTVRDIAVYDSPRNGAKISTIPANKHIQEKYWFYPDLTEEIYKQADWNYDGKWGAEWLYITSYDEGSVGWIKDENLAQTSTFSHKFDQEKYIYETIDSNEPTEKVLSAGEYKYTYYYVQKIEDKVEKEDASQTWYYIDDYKNNIRGWVSDIATKEEEELYQEQKNQEKDDEDRDINSIDKSYLIRHEDKKQAALDDMLWMLLSSGIISVSIILILIFLKVSRSKSKDKTESSESDSKPQDKKTEDLEEKSDIEKEQKTEETEAEPDKEAEQEPEEAEEKSDKEQESELEEQQNNDEEGEKND